MKLLAYIAIIEKMYIITGARISVMRKQLSKQIFPSATIYIDNFEKI